MHIRIREEAAADVREHLHALALYPCELYISALDGFPLHAHANICQKQILTHTQTSAAAPHVLAALPQMRGPANRTPANTSLI